VRILIAEDDLTTRRYLASILEKKGHQIVSVGDGEEAWQAIQADSAPRMLLLDWQMPKVEGPELCRRVRTLERDVKPYIIILTIKNEKKDIASILDGGADDYLTKPYDPGELFARIHVGIRMLELQESLVNRLATVRENERKIEKLLGEKNLILREVHHRMKNNMNTIFGLLKLQAETLSDPKAVSALADAGSRVQSMMVLYSNLYQSMKTTEMAVLKYFPVLIDGIIANFPNSGFVKVEKNIDDFILDVKKLQPLGIIVNELLTNIMKYAFSGRSRGTIAVSIRLNGNMVSVIIEDDGNGMPDFVDFDNSTGFGLVLVAGLAQQLDGTIGIVRGSGTKITLEFKR
jgi:two-component sensor histidine kinase